MPSLFQEVILAADLRCAKCRERIANAISRVDDVESMEVNLSKKKVTITCKSVSEEEPSRKDAVAVHDNQSRKAFRRTIAWFSF